MSFKLTSNIVNTRLQEQKSDIVLIGEYYGMKIKTTFKNIKCSHEWQTTPNHIVRRGTGCPYCANRVSLTKEIVNERLEQNNSDMRLIGQFTRQRDKSLFKHLKCGHEWQANVQSILNGKGCPKCVIYGFSPCRQAEAYVLKFKVRDKEFIKFGISNNLRGRLYSHNKNGSYEIIMTKIYENGHDAMNWESEIKRQYGGNYVDKTYCADGFTETLSCDLTQLVVNSLLEVNTK